MRAKYEFNGFENRLVIAPENDNERTLTQEFLALKPVGTKYVLRVPRQNDGKTIVIEKKQYITRNFLAQKGFMTFPGDCKINILVDYNKNVLFGFGAYWVGKAPANFNLYNNFNKIRMFSFNKRGGNILLLEFLIPINGQTELAIPMTTKIQTLEDFYKKI
jgi:hypothetical protein